MSAYRQYATDAGYVVSFADPEPAHELGLTEVKVAPLDAIVIDRSELPEVEVRRATGALSPEGHMRLALRHLAMREYLRANPPVDEAQVHAVADRLHSDTPIDATDRAELESIARRLVQNGVRVEVTP